MEKEFLHGKMEENILVLIINIGQYKNNKKHGFGIYIWSDGRNFTGNWNSGV